MKFRIKLIFCVIPQILFCMHENDISLQLPGHEIESNSDKKAEIRIVMSNGMLLRDMVPLSTITPLPQVGQSLSAYPLEQSIRDVLQRVPVDKDTRFVLKSKSPLAVVCMDIKPINITEPLECEVWCLQNPYSDNGRAPHYFLYEILLPIIEGKIVHISHPVIRQKLANNALSTLIAPYDVKQAINDNHATYMGKIEEFVSDALKQFVLNLRDKKHIKNFLSTLSEQDQCTIDGVLRKGIPFIIPQNEDEARYQEIVLKFIQSEWRDSVQSLGIQTKNTKKNPNPRYTTKVYATENT